MSEINKLEVISNIRDKCSKSQFENIFTPLSDLPSSSTKTEMISHCLNIELGAYGFKSYISPDRIMVLLNDEGICKVIDFAETSKINLLWAQSGISKRYYYFKQYSFNDINLLNINIFNSAAAALPPVGTVGMLMSGVVALS